MQKQNPPCTFPLIPLDYLLKICMILFDQAARDVKNVYVWKVTSSGRVENQNIKTTAISAILIFSSVNRGHFSNANILLTRLATWSDRKVLYRFLEDGLITEILWGMCKGGLIFSDFNTIPSRTVLNP